MANPFAHMAKQLGNIKSLRQEIIEIMGAATEPLTCAQIVKISEQSPDRETLSREVHNMKTAGILIQADTIEAPPGTARKTVATYRLNPDWKFEFDQEEGEPNAESAGVAAKRSPAYEPRGKAELALAVIRERGPVEGRLLASLVDIDVKSITSSCATLIKNGLLVKRKVGISAVYMTPEQAETFIAGPETTPPKTKQSKVEIPVSETREAVLCRPGASDGLRFIIGDDGSLEIIDDDAITRLEPADATRLGEFIMDCAPRLAIL